MYFAFIVSECIPITSSEEALRVWEHNFFQRKVVSLVIYLFDHDLSKSIFFMMNIAFDIFLSSVFVKEIWNLHFLQYKDYKNIFLFALYLDTYFFYYNVIVLHHGDGRSTEFNFIKNIDSDTDIFLWILRTFS